MVGLMVVTNAMLIFAAPKPMSDGNMFDAEYYAENNPDVVSVFGNDETMLYFTMRIIGNQGEIAI